VGTGSGWRVAGNRSPAATCNLQLFKTKKAETYRLGFQNKHILLYIKIRFEARLTKARQISADKIGPYHLLSEPIIEEHANSLAQAVQKGKHVILMA
jgi:hypothetical protein